MMKDGGPYSPSLYSATAPIRQAQKKAVDDLRIQQVVVHTKILEKQLGNDQADLDRYESSRQSFKADWETRERHLGEAMGVANKNMTLVKEELPLTEKDLRTAKDIVLLCERDQGTAESILADAEQKTVEAEAQLHCAAMKANAAKIEERTAKASLDSMRRAEEDAQSKYDSAHEYWLRYYHKLDEAESRRDAAVKNKQNVEKWRGAARAELKRARADQDYAKIRMESAGGVAGKTEHNRRNMEHAERAEQEAERAEQEAERAEQEAERAEQEAERAEQEAERAEQEAERAEQEAERAEDVAKKHILQYNMEIRNAEAEIAEAEGPECKTRQVMDNSKAVLQEVQNHVLGAKTVLSRAIQNQEKARKTMVTAEKALCDARKARGEAKTKLDGAKENTKNAKTSLQQVQHDMPTGEVVGSARRDLDVATKDLESAKRRYDVAGHNMTAADRREKSAALLCAAEEARLDGDAERWNAEGDVLTALEQIKDREVWAQDWFVSAKRMREAGESLRAARKRRTKSIQEDAEFSVQLARRWLSQDRATLDDAKERHAAATRWLNDAEREGWPSGGGRWPAEDQKALAKEQEIIKDIRALMDKWAEERMQCVKWMQDDASKWDVLVEEIEAEAVEAANIRTQNAQSIRDANNVFNLILKSLERVPEPGRTEANIDIYWNGVEATKSYRAIQGDVVKKIRNQTGGVSYNAKHRNRFVHDHPGVEQMLSSGQINAATLGALDAVLANMYSERVNISRDAEFGVTPSMDRWTQFREGMLVLAGQYLVLYDNSGRKELERIPLDLIKKCNAGGLFSSALNIDLVDGKRKFCLPLDFAAGHSESDEYNVWKYLLESRKTGNRGILRVSTMPPGAVVLVNDMPCGTTPLFLEKPILDESIIQRKYKVRILLEGHTPINKIVDLKCSKVEEKIKRLKKADPLADMAVQGYRKQVPGGIPTNLYVIEYVLNGENSTSLVLSRSSIIMLSESRQILLNIPYGALDGVEIYDEWLQVAGLRIAFRQDGVLETVKFAADKTATSECSEIKNKIKEKMQEWSDREPRSASNITQLPKPDYTFLNVVHTYQ